MVNLEQIRLLESRVQKAIQYIQKLRDENKSLRASLETYEKRIGDLESMVGDFKSGQQEIELSITNALKQLDQLEDALIEEPEETITPPKGHASSNPPAGGAHSRTAPKDRGSSSASATDAAHPVDSSIKSEHRKPGEHRAASEIAPRRTEKPQSDDDFEAKPIDAGKNGEDGLFAGETAPDEESAESELDIF
ncbi:MAG TPA: cell division protein ZapB [Spirochaetia bacterium]|nr:cell division protein ZapB [Spirochaetia bacterium]